MQRILAIARLTLKSAFRYRLFWVMAVLLVAAVVALPLILKDDGTAKGLTQILLTYTLTSITVLLGFATLWLSCGTLARDIDECQIQVVVTKPVARWQIWLGKWLGIIALNAMLLGISGLSVYMLLEWRARRLPETEQKILRDEIFVARASARERPPDLSILAKRLFDDWRRKHPDTQLQPDEAKVLSNQMYAEARAAYESIPPGGITEWRIDLSSLSARARSQPLQLRVKFHSSDPNPAALYDTGWRIGPTNSSAAQVLEPVSLPPDSYQELTVTNFLDDQGILTVMFRNDNEVTLNFPLEDGFEVLYEESSFPVNFARGMTVILCWLSLLSAIGLATASVLGFPVAAFCSLAILFVGLSTGTLTQVQESESLFYSNGEPPGPVKKIIDSVSVPVFGAVLKLVNLVESFSPVDALSTGHSITWGQLARAIAQIVLLMGGIFVTAGVLLFYRRELASVQSSA